MGWEMQRKQREERDTEKSQTDTGSEKRKRERSNKQRIKNLHKTEISLNEPKSSGQGCHPA